MLLAVCASGLFASLMPAWENNDELQHVQYIEYVAHRSAIPQISPANGWESGQPPLYYFLAAGWQALLRIPPFTPRPLPPIRTISGPVHLELDHRYNEVERRQAVSVHELRWLSVLLGVVTALATFGTALLATRRVMLASAAASFSALLPKSAEIFGAVTNDSLATCCCALATFLFVLWIQTTAGGEGRGLWPAAALGATLGLAAITKYTTLPVIGLLGLAMVVTIARRRRGLPQLLLAAAVTAGVGGWWYLRNLTLSGQLLEQTQNEVMLRHFFPGGVLVTKPQGAHLAGWAVAAIKGIVQTFWYVGGWNQLTMPTKASYLLGAAALVGAAWGAVTLFRRSSPADLVEEHFAVGLGLTLVAVAGVLGALMVAAETTQYQGRYVLVGVAAISTLVVSGTADLGHRLGRWGGWLGLAAWPLLMAGTMVWVLLVNVLPIAGL